MDSYTTSHRDREMAVAARAQHPYHLSQRIHLHVLPGTGSSGKIRKKSDETRIVIAKKAL